MPTWIVPIIAAVAALGSVALGAVLAHHYQQQRERDAEERAAHAASVARRRDLCAAIMETVIRNKGWPQAVETVHDNRAARLSARPQFQAMYHDLTTSLARVREWRAEFDLAPDSRLQDVLEQYGDALLAYQQALLRPFSSPWNPVQTYLSKTPVDVLRPLARECEVQTQRLQDVVRDYLAMLEHPRSPAKSRHTRLELWRRGTKATAS